MKLIYLFLFGLLFGVALGHFILAVLNIEVNPYGIQLSASINWSLGLIYLILTFPFLLLYFKKDKESAGVYRTT